MSAATIPLMYQPPKLENPVQAYGQLLSLKSLQQQMQQQQQLAPLILQQHQLQLQAAQREADANSKAAQYWQESQNEVNNPPAQPAPVPAPAAAPSTAQPRPLSSLAASDGNPAWQYQIPTSPDQSPSWTAAPPPAQGPAITGQLATTPAPAAPPSTPASPTAAPLSAEDRFQQKMSAAGYGIEGSRILQQRALAQRSQLEAKDALRADNDQTQVAKLWNDYGGDPAQMRINAAKYGVSPQGIQQMNINLLNLEKAQYDRTKLQADAGAAQNKLLTENYTAAAGRLAAFLKRPEDSSDEGQANWWDATLQGLYRDHLIDSNYLQSLQKQYPNGYPGQDAVQHLMATFNYASGISNGAKAMSEMSKASADQKAQTYSSLVTAAQSGPNAYHQALADNHVDPDSVPAQFDATGKPIPGAVDQLRQMGLTLEQQEASKNRAATLANTASNERVRNAILQQNADTNADRLRQSVAAQKAALQPGIAKVMTDVNAVMAGQGKKATPADYVSYLSDMDRWSDDPNVAPQRGNLIKAFQNMSQDAARTAHTVASTTKLQTGGKTDMFTTGPDGHIQMTLPQKPGASAPRGAPPAPPVRTPATPPAPRATPQNAAPPNPPAQKPPTPARYAVGTRRTLTQAQVDALAQRGIHNFHAGQTVTFDGNTWK